MQIHNFTETKEKGLVELRKYGENYTIIQNKFDERNGQPCAPEVEHFRREDITRQLEAHKKAVIDYTDFLAELDKVA